jgi:hypothetical protein
MPVRVVMLYYNNMYSPYFESLRPLSTLEEGEEGEQGEEWGEEQKEEQMAEGESPY